MPLRARGIMYTALLVYGLLTHSDTGDILLIHSDTGDIHVLHINNYDILS